MLGDLQDEYFLDAVYHFIRTTKEIYPGTNPIAIIREKAIALIPKMPYQAPVRSAEELQKIKDMQAYYDREKKKAEELFQLTSKKLPKAESESADNHSNKGASNDKSTLVK
jgi:hypothetical protein